jgi:NitT/TauT family transport system substrate-binding protein
MKKIVILSLAVLTLGCGSKESNKVSVRLKWAYQAQFAGYLVAEKQGFYKEEGLDVAILPAGPDIKSFMTVANGTDQFGVAMPNQIISARSNGVPLTIIAQIMQDSPYRYVLKKENRIDSLQQLRGKKIGLWLKADEAEFLAMLKKANMSLKDVQVIPQEYTVAPFLENKYVLSAVTVYNEINQIRSNGYEGDKLQVLSPKDFGTAFLGDMLFCKQEYLDKNPETVRKFLAATLKGWQYTVQNPDKALKIVLTYNKELNLEQQKKQLEAVIQLIKSGKTSTEGIGFIDENQYINIDKILRESGQIQGKVDIKSIYDSKPLQSINKKIKMLK